MKATVRTYRVLDNLKMKANSKYNDSKEEITASINKILEICKKYNIDVSNYLVKVETKSNESFDFKEFKNGFYRNISDNLVYKMYTDEFKFIYITIKVCINGKYGVFSNYDPIWADDLNKAYEIAYDIYKYNKYKKSQDWF